MKQTLTQPAALLRKFVAGLAACTLLSGAAQAQTVWGLAPEIDVANTRFLVSFSAAAPATVSSRVLISGIASGQQVVGIDFRPNTGELYALAYNASTIQTQLYVLNRTTGAATSVAPAISLNLGTNLNRIGFDFNPTVDRIRVVNGAGADYRLHPTTGALAATDGALAYASTDPNAGQTPGVGSVAYTNSYIGSTSTLLYDLDETNNRLTTQNPPNNGTLNTVGTVGVAVSTLVNDLDVSFNATTGANTLYMSTAGYTTIADAVTRLYTVNTTTGAATQVGQVGPTGTYITDIAIQIDRPATLPTITGQLVYALAGTNLLTFDSAQPGLVRTSVGITGVDAAQTLVGLDVRPLNNALYALGYNATTQAGQLYTINATTGVATATSASIALALGSGSIGFDFNPTVDRIRVVGANRNNYRLNPVTGTLAATDGPVAYTSGTNTPTIGAVAYTNSFAGSTTTTLYNYDEALNLLNTQSTANPPADGQLTTVGSSGITANLSPANVDMDIYSTSAGNNQAYLVATTGTSANSTFYTLNLTTGAATAVGSIGNGITVRDIAVAAATGVTNSTRPAADLASDLSLYPNPTAGAAQLSFNLVRAAHVTLVVTDALGRQVDVVEAGNQPAGTRQVSWNRRAALRPGVYFFTLQLNGQPAATLRGVVLN